MGASLWLFLPTYNEAGNVDAIVRAAAEELERAAPGDWGILVVDDASPDGTGDLADRVAEEIDGVEVLHRPAKEGLGRAYLAGFDHALERGAQLVIVMDADFSHDPKYLPAILAAAGKADLVLGSRYVPGGGVADWPRLRRVLSRAGSLYARSILGVGVRDLTSGFRCVRRRVLETDELLDSGDELYRSRRRLASHGTVVVGIVQGVLGGIGFWVVGLPSPVFWGVIMALLGIIP
jgi:dolichol-phosphate mannosyltransferase